MSTPNNPSSARRRRPPSTVGYFLEMDGISAAKRRREINDYCCSKHLRLLGVFSDAGELRHKPFLDRPAATKLLNALSSSTHIVFPTLKGTFVSVSEAAHVLGRFRRYRKKLHFLQHPIEPFSTAGNVGEGRAFWSTLKALGALDKYAARAAWAASSAEHKVAGFVRGATPYGYDRDGTLLIENPSEQKIIERIRTLAAVGASYRDIAATLNSEGVPTKKSGGKWHAATVQRAAAHRMKSTDDDFWRPQDWSILAKRIESRRINRGRWRKI